MIFVNLLLLFIGAAITTWIVFVILALMIYSLPTFLEWIFDKIDKLNE